MIVRIEVRLVVQPSGAEFEKWNDGSEEEQRILASQFIGLKAVESLVGRGDNDGYVHPNGSRARVYGIVAPDSPEPEQSGAIEVGKQPEECPKCGTAEQCLANEEEEGMVVIMAGNPCDGLRLIGPFRDYEEANDWAEETKLSRNDYWWTPALQNPNAE